MRGTGTRRNALEGLEVFPCADVVKGSFWSTFLGPRVQGIEEWLGNLFLEPDPDKANNDSATLSSV